MLEFAQTVNPNLENYETDGVRCVPLDHFLSESSNGNEKAWPTLLDEFVVWKKGKMEAA